MLDKMIGAIEKQELCYIREQKDGLERENTLWTNQCTRTTEHNVQEANELSRLSNN